MHRPEIALKVSEIHKLRGNGLGPNRGGNGKLTAPQKLLSKVLGPEWEVEYAISLGTKQPGYPTCYKVDLGNPKLKIAIECDGNGHKGKTRKLKDSKKDTKLAELGWQTYRIWNKTILRKCLTSRLMGHHTILQMAYLSTTAKTQAA
jgi:hypothetical protein